MSRAILQFKSPDRKGLVHEVTGFILANGGNVLELEQFVARREDLFFMRVEWSMEGFNVPFHEFDRAFAPIQDRFKAEYRLYDSKKRDRLALMVSKELHCLAEVLIQQRLGNLPAEIPLVIGNHEQAGELAASFGIPFHCTPVGAEGVAATEKEQIRLLREHRVELVGLARYMRILSGGFLEACGCPVINIHHSFLPAFAGANPYRQAYERGVKIIGATSHFVSEELDAGPIIAQDTEEVRHVHSVKRLKKVGEEIEKKVFLHALKKYLERKIVVYGNRTVVFD